MSSCDCWKRHGKICKCGGPWDGVGEFLFTVLILVGAVFVLKSCSLNPNNQPAPTQEPGQRVEQVIRYKT